MQHADEAMYDAKVSDHSVHRYSTSRMANHGRLALLGELERAIVECEVGVHYQPKVDLASGRVVGLEALARWNHPRLGMIMPEQFVSLAEQTELMAPFTARVLSESLSQCAAWQRMGMSLTIAVNVSARNLQDRDFPGLVADLLSVSGLAAQLVGARGDRERASRRPGTCGRSAGVAPLVGSHGRDRRLRNRIFVAVESAGSSRRSPQDRSFLCHRHDDERRRRGRS